MLVALVTLCIGSTVKCDVCERDIAPQERNNIYKLGIICKPCVKKARAEGKKIKITNYSANEVFTIEALIEYVYSQLGVISERYQADRVILRHCGYSLKELAETVDWMAREGKRINEPWKICYWVDYCQEHQVAEPMEQNLGYYQQRLNELYATFTPAQKIKVMDAIQTEDQATNFYLSLFL